MWKPRALKGFSDAAQSLKLYRRAELLDQQDKPLIDKLYVDPLPGNAVLNAMIRPNTTFVIGRKGTGKSTVFQRAQREIRKQRNSVSAYIDIKTVYEASSVDSTEMQKISDSKASLGEDQLKKLLLYKSFIRAVFSDVRRELKAQFESSFFEKVRETFGAGRDEIFDALDGLIEGAFDSDFEDVTGVDQVGTRAARTQKDGHKISAALDVAAKVSAAGVSGDAKISHKSEESASDEREVESSYARVLMRKLNITGIISELQELLGQLGIRHLYIFVDDFSELPEDAMSVFVDTVLAPLNNWSNELIKFKIAAYPGRIYYGKIDKTKIDEIYLDLFKLYGSNDVTTMEDKAVDFTRRLIDNRLQHYCKMGLQEFCKSSASEVERHLFYATMGNPRNLGHMLFNLQESHLSHGNEITVRSVRDASAKYYEEKIEPFFGMQKFRQESFTEKASVFSLKELLEEIVDRARELRNYKGSATVRAVEGQPPTSHFHVVSELESLLLTLELNFFLTKYFEMKDRDGVKVSIFALNYGLCNKLSIEFGRPGSKREHRLYFVERIFDDTGILRRFLQNNQEIKCDNCSEVYGVDKLEGLAMFDMMCPKCRVGTCQVVNLSKKYQDVLARIKPELLLPSTELGILETLFSEKRKLYAREIAEELDCSHQLIGRRTRIMEQRGLVDRVKEKQTRVYSLTAQAQSDYFAHNQERSLQVAEPGSGLGPED